MGFWNYIFENILILAIFFAGYELFLKNSKFFNFSRFYFLFGILLCLALPFFRYSILIEVEAKDLLNSASGNFKTIKQISSASLGSLNPEEIIFIGYLMVSLGFLSRFLFQLLQLRKFINNSEIISEIKGIKLRKTDKCLAPFSFFNYIFLDQKTLKHNTRSYTLKHELIHAKQYHSLDVLLVQLVNCFIWVNPIIYFYKKRLIDNLEFITDQEVIKKCAVSTTNYQYQLLSRSLSIPDLPILSFNHSSIKKRIIMLNTRKTNKLQLLKLFILIPFLSLVFYSCNVNEVETINKTSGYSFYFNRNTDNEELQNKVKIFNHFYKDSVALKITNVQYKNDLLNSFSMARKYYDQPDFKKSFLSTGISKSDLNYILTFNEGKIILSSNKNFSVELDKNSNQMFFSQK